MEAKTAEIWDEFHDKLFGYIISKVKSREIANDILQDVFVKIHLNLSKLRKEEKLISWLYQITRNQITDHFRKRKFSTELPELESEEYEQNPLLEAADCCLRKFINQLPSEQKEAIEKAYFEEIPQKELADQLGISYTGLKSRVQRGRAKLEEWLNDCCCAELDRLEADSKDCTC